MGRQKRDKQNKCGGKLGLKKGQLRGNWAGTGLGLGRGSGLQGLVADSKVLVAGEAPGQEGSKGFVVF